jgi:GNAT superfamily N-acetyltransferase
MDIAAEPSHHLILTEEAHPDSDTIRAFKQGVDEFNFAAVGPDSYLPIWIIGRDPSGTVHAGMHAHIAWSWLFLDWLWVAAAYRGHGLGAQFLLRAEAMARDHGCAGVYLNTFSFQAPGFYLRHGYQEIGRLEGMPPGHDRIWFSKRL